MDSHHPWLRAEIAQWLREGLIDDELAQRLYARYPAQVNELPPRRWGRLLLAALVGLLLVLVVSLLFSYFWDGMPQHSKLLAVAAAVLLCHGLAWWQRADRRLAEALHLLGSLLLGAVLWLLAPLYYPDGRYAEGIMLWSLAALLMAWLLPSVAHAVLACVLICAWTVLEVSEFEQPHFLGTGLLLVGLLPLAWRLRSTLLWRSVLLLLPLSVLLNSWCIDSKVVLFHGALLAALYLWLERLAPRMTWTGSVAPLYQSGMLLWWGSLLLLSFSEVAADQAMLGLSTALPAALTGMSLLIAIGACAVWSLWHADLRPHSAGPQLELLCLALPLLALCINRLQLALPVLLPLLANLAVLVYALMFLYRGSQQLQRASMVAGGGLLVLLLLARFTDLYHGLAERLVLLLSVVLLLAAAGIRFSRQQERRKLALPGGR